VQEKNRAGPGQQEECVPLPAMQLLASFLMSEDSGRGEEEDGEGPTLVTFRHCLQKIVAVSDIFLFMFYEGVVYGLFFIQKRERTLCRDTVVQRL
jgi:hypothetical protein